MFDICSKPRSVVSRLAALAAAGLFAFTASAFAQTDAQAIVPNRITQIINPDNRVTLKHNVYPLAQAKFDQGAAPGSLATGRIMLILKRSDTQENALKQYLGDLQNPKSSSYRKWLSPAQFGKLYGISDTDLTTVTAWLQSQGFTVDKVPQGRNVIIFSGNMAQIQQAFHTTIHRYLVNGAMHLANSTDPQIPAALASVVAGVAPLNDFHPKRGASRITRAHFDKDTNSIKPDLTLVDSQNNNYLFVGPADAATIYDTPNATLNGNYVSSVLSGKTYDGTGVTIGIAGDSNITASDVANYRAGFLPSNYASNVPNIIVDGNDPGITGDAIEALLDLEVSGGIAPGANINFYTAADTDFQSGLFLAIYRALDDNNVSILNVSFGACEAFQLTSGNQQIYSAWEQAAAQGISVTVSTGDSGSAGCDNDNTETTATDGLAVNGLASTPYNIAVGGTDFDTLINNFSTYVNTTNGSSNYYRTAKSYIPENPWNDSPQSNTGKLSTNTAYSDTNGNTNIVGAGGGVSSCTEGSEDASGNITCTAGGYVQPAFQTGVVPGSLAGSGSSAVRAVPDVSLFASDEAYFATWVVCADSVSYPASDGSTYADCTPTGGPFSSTSNTTFTGVGGTSAAAPAFAGMLALVSQSQGGARLGQANNVLYNLAHQTALYNTIFHDTTAGNNSVVCTSGSTDCGSNGFLTGYDTAVGYDAASGLGSLDVSQLIANWTKTGFLSTNTSLSIGGATASVVHGTPLNFAVTVSPSTATGDVSIVNDSGLENNGALPGEFLTLLPGGTASGSTGDLPGGMYNVYAYYGGDVNHTGSQSTPVSVNITPEPSQTVMGAFIYDPVKYTTLCDDFDAKATSCAGISAPYGYATSISAQPQGASGSNTTATGTVDLSDSAGQLTYNNTASATVAVPIANNGIASYNNYAFQNQTFSVASHSLSAAYKGDASYSASSTTTPLGIKVTQGTTTTVAQATQSSSTVTLQATVNTDSVGLAPTGTVTFKNGSTTLGTVSTSAATGFVSNGTNEGESVAALYTLQIPSSKLSSSVKTAKLDHSGFSWKLSGGIVVACLFFFAVPARRRSWRAMLGVLVFALLISNVIACGSTSNNSGGGGGGGGSATITAVYAGDVNYSTSTSAAVAVTVGQ